MSEKIVTFDNVDEAESNALKARKSRRRSGKMVAAAVVAVLLVILFGGYGLFRSAGIIGGNDRSYGHDYIAVFDIDGEISEGSSSLLESSTSYHHQWMMDRVDALVKDRHNKGIMLRINTPGGSAYLSDGMYCKLEEYKDRTQRPIYTYMESQACSGGYYIASASDRIYANRNTWTGSIGVTTGTFYDITGLLDKLGIKATTITSGRNKAMGSETQEMTEEQRAIIQSLIDEAYDQFVGIVAKSRDMDEATVRKLADGRVYTAKQALDHGLIDGIMTEAEAFEQMKKDEKLTGCKFEELAATSEQTSSSFLDSLIGKISAESELDAYQQLISLAKNGNIVSIEYMSSIRK